MIEQFDLLVRTIAIGASLMLLALLVEGEMRREFRISLVGLIVGTVGYLINSTPLIGQSNWVDPWVELVSLSPPFWIWLFSRQLFEREPPQRVVMIAVAGLLSAWFIGNFFSGNELPTFYAIHLISLALIVDLVRIALMDRADDLVEKRRIIRVILPLLVAAQAGGILIFEMITASAMAIPTVQLANAVLILVLILFAGTALMRTDQELLFTREEVNTPEEEMVPELDLSPSEKVLHDKLTAAMDEGAFTAPGLTISVLADQLETPEHRLRALINGQLGHRNFSAFLNRYRVAEAQRKLSSSEHVDFPILTIAMDLGYNSLPPFNRAFRELTGSSPSEFRKRAFVEEPAETAMIEADQK